MMTSWNLRIGAIMAVALLSATSVAAQAAALNPLAVQGPVASEFAVKAAAAVPSFGAMPVDRAWALSEDVGRAEADLPPRFALPQVVDLTPENAGIWENLDENFVMWRLRIISRGALSLNLGFTSYRLPAGGRLSLYPTDIQSSDDPRGLRVFTEMDNEEHGELWTPVVVADDIMVELVLPVESRRDYDLVVGSVNRGYRFFGESMEQLHSDKSGTCNVDVVCPEGNDWQLEIDSVGVISTGGSLLCSGAMLNNTAEDGTPYFLTANHCGINLGNAASLVVYWNYQSPICGIQSGGSLADFQTGSVFLAAGTTSDFTLVRMDDPVNPAHGVSFAGWDRSTANPTSATAIHHPSTDEKSISFEYQATTTTSYTKSEVPGDGTHIRVADWDVGTTELGSSGSPLFDQNHHVVGQLHGGYAACGNNLSDWYGRFSASWAGIASWLDPTNSGVTTLDAFGQQTISVGWANLVGPATLSMVAGATTDAIYGQARIDDLTIQPGATSGLVAQLGYGADGSDPVANPGTWHWVVATYCCDLGNTDEFVGTLSVLTPGQYDYCYRYSYQGGPWLYGDLDGTNTEHPYAPSQAGSLTVSPPFTEINASLPGVHEGSVQWGDYDNDGDLDLVVTGDTGAGYISRIYRNNGGGSFTDINAVLPGVSLGNVAWGDYDNDGDLDLALSGELASFGPLSRLYRNDGGTFVDANVVLISGLGSRLAWGDYDNDGDLDLCVATNDGDWENQSPTTLIYRNDGSGVFRARSPGLPGLWGGSVAWGDYDNDGDLDLFLTGNADGAFRSAVYRNSGGFFFWAAEFTGTWAGSGQWGDYDSDGDLDILQTGATSYDLTRVYRNDGGTFADINADLPPLQRSTAVWGDYDNDGDLDILAAGYCYPTSSYVSGVWRNDAGVFVDAQAGLVPVNYSGVIPAAWGDYDNDGRLDIAVSTADHVLRIYHNVPGTPANTPPSAPGDLEVSAVGDQMTFSWSAATDAQTPAAGLSYNLRVGTTPGGSQSIAVMANAASGYRRVAARGNAQQRLTWTLTLPTGYYYHWSVQAVDGAFAGGPFAEEMMYASDVVDSPVPREFALHAISPNPFNPATTIAFSLPQATSVRLAVYDLSGRLVRTLVDEARAAGRHEEMWNGLDDRGQQVASGVYVCRMEAGAYRESKRMTLVK